MALDPTLPLQIAQASQIQDPLTQYGRILALKNALGQGQVQQQQIQAGNIDLQQKQLGLDQTKALNDAYKGSLIQSPDGSVDIDTGKLTQALSASGHGSAIPGVLKGVQDYKKSAADLQETQGKVAQQQRDNAGDLGATVKAADNDPQLFLTMATHATASKLIDPQAAQPYIQAVQQALQADPTGAQAKQIVGSISDRLIAGSEGQQKLINERNQAQARVQASQTGTAKEARESGQQQFTNSISDLAANPPKDAAEYAQRVGQLPYGTAQRIFGAVPAGQYDPGKSPAVLRNLGMTPEQQTQAQQATTNQNNEQKYRQTMEGVSQGRLSIAQADLELKKQQFGFDTNGGTSPTAQLAAEGKIDPQTLRGIIRRNPGIIGQIQKVDPNFDEASIDNRYNTLKEFNNTSNGKAGGQVLALNTLIHHADLYQQVAQSLHNGTFVPGNAVYNSVAQAFGSAPPTNAALVGRFLAGETGKVATGGVPAEGEINGILKSLNTNASPDQIAQAGKTLLQVAAGRATPLIERAKQAKIDNIMQVIGPDAQQILQRNGFDPKTMKPVAAPSTAHVIAISGKQYRYNGSGDTADLKNYTEIK